jgi:hypothetical protein
MGAVGVGIGVQSLASTWIPDLYSSAVEQVCQTVWGQTTFMLGTQIVANFPATRSVGLVALGAMLGVNVALGGKKLNDNKFALTPEDPLPEDELEAAQPESPRSNEEFRGGRFQPFSWSLGDVVPTVLKVAGAAGCIFTWFRFQNPLAGGLALWGAAYWVSEPLGQFSADDLRERVKKEEQASRSAKESPRPGVSQLQSFFWRRVQTGAATASYVLNALLMIPWGKPHTAARRSQLWITGLSMGFFGGFLHRIQWEELRGPIDQIPALKPRYPEIENRVFKIWERVWPALVHGAVAAYVASQWVSSNVKLMDKVAVGAMYAGYLYAAVKGWLIERYWDQERRCVRSVPSRWDRFVDGRVVSQILPRIAGINPIHFYYAMEMAMPLRTGQELGTFEQVLRGAALFCYGKGTATEFEQTRSEKRGSLFFSPMMLFMNGVLTMSLFAAGASDE